MHKLKIKLYDLLRWSERYTKTDMVYLAKGGAWLSLSNLVGIFIGIGMAIIFANWLPKETLGIYRYVLSLTALLSIPTLTKMSTALTRSVSQGNDGALIEALITKLKWGSLATVVSIGIALYYFIQNNTLLGWSFSIVAVCIPFFNTFSIYGAFLHGKKLFAQSAQYQTLTQIASFLFLGTTIIFTDNMLLILGSYFVPPLLLRLYFFKKTTTSFIENTSRDPEMIPYGKHLSFINILEKLAAHIDKILLWHFLGPITLAVYTFALMPVKHIRSVFKNIVPLALPKLSTRTPQELRETLPRKILFLFLIILGASLAYIITAPFLFSFLFPEYLEAVLPSQILALGLLLYPRVIIRTSFTAHMKTSWLYFLSTSDSLLRIVLFLILIPLYGIVGAIIVRLVGELFISISSLILFTRLGGRK